MAKTTLPQAPKVTTNTNNVRQTVAQNVTVNVLSVTVVLDRPSDVKVNWNAWFGSINGTGSYGRARMLMNGVNVKSSGRVHVGTGPGYSYSWEDGNFYNAGILPAGTYTFAYALTGESPNAMIFNPGAADSSDWQQATSELSVTVTPI